MMGALNLTGQQNLPFFWKINYVGNYINTEFAAYLAESGSWWFNKIIFYVWYLFSPK